MKLLQAAGVVVPVGATLWLDGHELSLPVGYDGLVYADIPDGKHVLDARWTDGACRERLEVVKSQAKPEFCSVVPP